MTVVDRRDAERFRDVVARRLGLFFDDAKLDQLADVLLQRIEERGDGRTEPYLTRLSAEAWREEWRAVAECLTVSETYFFRYRDHFRTFSEVVLPACARAAGGERPLRVLSAGCASGEEAYSLAILAREALPEGDRRPAAILGVDVNASSIAKARSGRYTAWAFRETPEELRERYFRPDGRERVLDEAVRASTAFQEANLVEEDPALWLAEGFDVVFCRNVLMYLTPEAQRAVVVRIARALRPGGFLFLGHAETLRGLSDGFHLRHTHDAFYYERRSADALPRLDTNPPPATAVPAPQAEPLAPADSWVEAIGRASARIATLADRPHPAAASPGEPDGRRRHAPRRPRRDVGVALELLREERFAEALDLLPPESGADADARLLRAVLLTNAGRLAEAQEACRELLERDELHAGAHYLVALCREHAGDRQGALDHDRIALYLDPAFAMARLHLGLVAGRDGHEDVARRELGQALLLLAREDASRILLFGGGFSRDALVELCRAKLRSAGGAP